MSRSDPVYEGRTDSIVVGIDVGSTTVKATVVNPDDLEIIWSDYMRHETKQPEKVLELLVRIGNSFPDVATGDIRTFITGSGAGPIAEHINSRFVQEVNAVTMAVEKLHPDAGSVVELGGQDAKIIIFKENEETGDKQASTSMNDKCASGTGATIDKCFIKVGMPQEETNKLHFDPSKLHHVAAKCGVFAETDIVNLVKAGIPSEEILCSLADAIVMQNLSVLTRGNTLRHNVILLGGPNTFLPFLQECWRMRIPETWEDRGYHYPKDRPIEDIIIVPENAEYYAAYGAVLYGLHEPAGVGVYTGLSKLRDFISHGRKDKLGEAAGPPLAMTSAELEQFRIDYAIPKFEPATFEKGEVVRAVIGLDGGSTSSKCVIMDEDGRLLKKEYQLSRGNPIKDMRDMLKRLKEYVESFGATLDIFGFGATGYAADVLEKGLKADVNIVETVAHMQSAQSMFGEIDVICDIGGQDIKVLFLQNKEMKNFRLSNQCSAGNGMLLQAMAAQFGVSVEDYAETAFKADLSPNFSYGCAVFLDTDRVNFQKEGYSKEELMAGLAMVLPKNIWQYVVQIPRMAELGTRYVLQGGTQYNLAAVKAQVDYIKDRVPDAEVHVHPHPGEAGAIGAAMETLRVVKKRGYTTWVGLDQAIDIEYSTINDESTVCQFCPNHCSRTFIDTVTPDGSSARYISGFSCEKGTVEDHDSLRALNKDRRAIMEKYPNLVTYESKGLWTFRMADAPEMPSAEELIDDIEVKKGLFGFKRSAVRRRFSRSSSEAWEARKEIRIGMPKVLNMWSTGPFWRAYFETVGIDRRNVVFSDNSGEEMFAAGGKYGSVDPCYPAKVAQAHIHNLLFKHHVKKPLNYIYFPTITHISTFMDGVEDSTCCPIVAGTPNVVKAAFTKEVDFFAVRDIEYVDEAVSFTEPNFMKRQMFQCWGERLGITEDESDFAYHVAQKTMIAFDDDVQSKGKAILEQVEEETRMCILLIGRPYHLDPGLNHDVTEEFQALGYPVISMRSIPKDNKWLERFFRDDLERGKIVSPVDINDVWPENYSTNSAQKVWAAKFASRHPNVAILDLSSFKCGHDAPTYGIIDAIVRTANAPYSALHDIDANKPVGSIKIRVKTYAYSLELRSDDLVDKHAKERMVQRSVAVKHLELLKKRQELVVEAEGEPNADVEAHIKLLTKELYGRDEMLAEVSDQNTDVFETAQLAKFGTKPVGKGVRLPVVRGTDGAGFSEQLVAISVRN